MGLGTGLLLMLLGALLRTGVLGSNLPAALATERAGEVLMVLGVLLAATALVRYRRRL